MVYHTVTLWFILLYYCDLPYSIIVVNPTSYLVVYPNYIVANPTVTLKFILQLHCGLSFCDIVVYPIVTLWLFLP